MPLAGRPRMALVRRFRRPSRPTRARCACHRFRPRRIDRRGPHDDSRARAVVGRCPAARCASPDPRIDHLEADGDVVRGGEHVRDTNARPRRAHRARMPARPRLRIDQPRSSRAIPASCTIVLIRYRRRAANTKQFPPWPSRQSLILRPTMRPSSAPTLDVGQAGFHGASATLSSGNLAVRARQAAAPPASDNSAAQRPMTSGVPSGVATKPAPCLRLGVRLAESRAGRGGAGAVQHAAIETDAL